MTPDYQVRVNRDLLQEQDGPMLEHGLQAMRGRTLRLPARRSDRPDQQLLAVRFEQFLAAG